MFKKAIPIDTNDDNIRSFETTYLTHTWWRHQMKIFSALLAFCEGPPVADSHHKGQ